MGSAKRVLLLLLVAGVVGTAGFVGVDRLAAANEEELEETSPEPDARAETTEVIARDLTEEVSVNGTVDHGESWSLGAEGDGIVTSTPTKGTTLQAGDELVRIGDRPIHLADGSVPLHRTLRLVSKSETDEAGDRIGKQTGDDVAQLQRFLLDQGFDDAERLEADGIFGISTQRAVKAWQKSVGHPATGQVDRSQLVFIDAPVRVESAPRVGDRFSDITVTGVQPVVTVDATSRQRSFFTVGTELRIDTDGVELRGRVVELERTVGADGSTAHRARIEFSDPDVPEVETAKVISTRVVAAQAPSVPVRALVALAEGGWALQVITDGQPTLTAVTLGEIVDGIAEIDGVPNGTEVVIPA